MEPVTTIRVENVSKLYHIYAKPSDRLKQIFLGWRSPYYREFVALKNINFSIKKGQSVGVIGRNGAGKSTLLQILTGTLSPTEGKVAVNGRVAAVLELGAGFNPEFSGRENIYLYASIFGLSKRAIDARLQEIIDFSEIERFVDQPVKTYSSGMQARLAFSVIAHVDADILIIDEALSVGDAVFTQKCMRFLRKFQVAGTIFFVSHDLSAVTAFCQQAIWIESGEIKEIGSAKEVCEHYYSYMNSKAEAAGLTSNAAAPQLAGAAISPRVVDSRSAELVEPTESYVKAPPAPGQQVIDTFGFNVSSACHGSGEAQIDNVSFTDSANDELTICDGRKKVKVKIGINILQDLDMPIVGFIIKDRLGQPLIGGNTYHTYKLNPVPVTAGEYLQVEFCFDLPILAVGDYSIVAAIGNGTLPEHYHVHWMHDAVLFKVVATSIDGVIVGMPLDKISMSKLSQHP